MNTLTWLIAGVGGLAMISFVVGMAASFFGKDRKVREKRALIPPKAAGVLLMLVVITITGVLVAGGKIDDRTYFLIASSAAALAGWLLGKKSQE